jgi:integrase
MTFEDRLNDAFTQMMDYREAVGYATATYRCSVPPFISFCIEKYPDAKMISSEMVDEWLALYNYSNNSQAAFISLLREFTKYLNFLGYSDYIPDEDYSLKRTTFNPYLFTDEELKSLFDTIDGYTGDTCGKRYLPEGVMPVYTRLLFCCGMRPQEPPALRCEDIDLSTGDIYTRQSKRHKDRHIIMSDDMLDLCIRYDSIAGKREWFFQKWNGESYERKWYSQLWTRLLDRSVVK